MAPLVRRRHFAALRPQAGDPIRGMIRSRTYEAIMTLQIKLASDEAAGLTAEATGRSSRKQLLVPQRVRRPQVRGCQDVAGQDQRRRGRCEVVRELPKPKGPKMSLKDSPGFTALSLLLPLLLLGLQAGCTTPAPAASAPPVTSTPAPTASELQRLQGTWEGVLVGDKSDDKYTVTITGNSFHFHRDPNFWFATTITAGGHRPAAATRHHQRLCARTGKQRRQSGRRDLQD